MSPKKLTEEDIEEKRKIVLESLLELCRKNGGFGDNSSYYTPTGISTYMTRNGKPIRNMKPEIVKALLSSLKGKFVREIELYNSDRRVSVGYAVDYGKISQIERYLKS